MFKAPVHYRAIKTSGFVLFLLLAVLPVTLGLLPGCGGAPEVDTDVVQLDRLEELRADRLLRQMRDESLLHRDRAVLDIGYELIDRYRGYTHNDEVTLLAGRSAQRLGDMEAWRRLSGEFLMNFPNSSFRDDGLQLASDLAAADADTFKAADYLIRVYERQPVARRAAAAQAATIYLDRLGADELTALIEHHPDSGLRPYMGFLQTQRLLEEGRRTEAGNSIGQLQSVAPESEWAAAAEKLLSDPGYRRVPGHGSSVSVADEIPTRVGVLCPLTGRYAVLGNAFYDGALMAQNKINSMGWRRYEVSVEDSRADPVDAALGARKLIDETGVMAVVGSLMSAPTAAAAIVADGYGVPMVSPTATNERIWELGAGVFQTNLTRLFEARLLARLATDVLLKERFAILYPDNPSGARSFQVFAEEVTAGGGTIVAAAAFDPQATDFRQPILNLKEARPEVMFVDASVDEMVLLGPQLDFYRIGALIMGPSTWNSAKLEKRTGTILERAIFPSDTALFPAEWLAHFNANWDDEQLPAEATPLALKAFQATMLVLDTLGREGMHKRYELTTALRQRLGERQVDSTGPAEFASTARMFRGGEIVAFPAELFIGTWPTPELPDIEPESDEFFDEEPLDELVPEFPDQE